MENQQKIIFLIISVNLQTWFKYIIIIFVYKQMYLILNIRMTKYRSKDTVWSSWRDWWRREIRKRKRTWKTSSTSFRFQMSKTKLERTKYAHLHNFLPLLWVKKISELGLVFVSQLKKFAWPKLPKNMVRSRLIHDFYSDAISIEPTSKCQSPANTKSVCVFSVN